MNTKVVKKLNNENFSFISSAVELSEHDTYLELTNRLCYYDAPNLNGVLLPSEGAEDAAQTLVDMPVVARYTQNSQGEPTFRGHELYTDEDGNPHFGTESVGVHTDVYIKQDTVALAGGGSATLPCLFASYKIWKRKPNVVQAVRRLYELGKLFSSWEITTSAYEYADGIKRITGYSFLGNALLGFEYASPAYGPSAKAISLSAGEVSPALLLAAAHAQDLNIPKEEETVNTEKKDTGAAQPENAPVPEKEPAAEAAALTIQDLYDRLRAACEVKLGGWCYIAQLFPAERQLWVRAGGAESELDYLLFTYEVTGDSVEVSEPVAVKLTVSIAQLNEHVEKLAEAVAAAARQTKELEEQLAGLEDCRAKYEAAEAEKVQAALQQQRDELRRHALASGMIEPAELDDGTFADLLEELDKPGIDAVIAQRLIEKAAKAQPETASAPASTNRVALATDVQADHRSIMDDYLKGK